MNEPHERERPVPRKVTCRRTGQTWDTTQCTRCPYCYGDDDDLARGRPRDFCDYHVGKDPVSFGFPGDDRRSARG